MILPTIFEKCVEHGATFVFRNRKRLARSLKFSTVNRNRTVRVSISHILCCSRNNEYLLIHNFRRKGSFAPIGGVVKYFAPAHDYVLNKIGFIPEFPLECGTSDLRGKLKGSEIGTFLEWLDSGEYLESGTLQREIVEELSESREHRLAKEVPANLQFKLLRIVHEGPTQVPGRTYLQYRVFSVFEFQTYDKASSSFLGKLQNATLPSSRFRWVSRDDIFCGSTKDGMSILDNASYLIGDKRLGNEPRPITAD